MTRTSCSLALPVIAVSPLGIGVRRPDSDGSDPFGGRNASHE
jgi:hypothetical protein